MVNKHISQHNSSLEKGKLIPQCEITSYPPEWLQLEYIFLKKRITNFRNNMEEMEYSHISSGN